MQSLQIKFQTFDKELLNLVALYIYNLSKIYAIPVSFSSLPKKIRKFTVLRSPHIDKKSREQFEIRVYSMLFEIPQIEKTPKFINDLTMNLPYGIYLKISNKIK